MDEEIKHIPRFSIIIPVYNAENKVSKCLNSVCSQSFEDYEVILIDDGSTDNSLSILYKIRDCNPRRSIRVFTQQNVGAGRARNRGIELAVGEYLVFVDSDDYIESNYLEKINKTIEAENSDVVFIDIVRENEDGIKLRYERMSDFSKLNKDQLIRQQMTGKMPWGGCRKVPRADIVKNNDIKYGSIKVGEESIYSYRVLEKASSISFQPEAIYHYVEATDSLTSHDVVSNSLMVFDFMYDYFKESGILEKYVTTMRSMAITTVAIAINVLTQQNSFMKAHREASRLIKKYKIYTNGKVDINALEKRVLICLPWIKLGIPLPIICASKLQQLIRKELS